MNRLKEVFDKHSRALIVDAQKGIEAEALTFDQFEAAVRDLMPSYADVDKHIKEIDAIKEEGFLEGIDFIRDRFFQADNPETE